MNNVRGKHLDEKELHRYLDEEIAADAAAGHLADCPTCRSLLGEMRMATATYAAYSRRLDAELVRMHPPQWPDFDARLMAWNVSPAALQGNRWRGFTALPRMLRFAFVALAVAFLCAAGILTGRWIRAAAKERTKAAPSGKATLKAWSGGPATNARRFAAGAPVISTVRSTEVAAMQVLHRLRADLGEPVELSADEKGQLVVACNGVSPERQAEIHAAFSSVSGVVFRNAEPPQSALNRASKPDAVAFAPGSRPFGPLGENAVGGSAAFEKLANAVQDESESLLAVAHAMRNLDRRFSAARIENLGAEDRATVGQIRADYGLAYVTHARNILNLLAPVRKALASSEPATKDAGSSDFFSAANRVDRVVSMVFGGAPADRSTEGLAAELEAAARQLEKVSQ